MVRVERREGMFKYCPLCGKAGIYFAGPKELRCRYCSFTYFHNVAAAAAAILEFDGKIILLKRAREPRMGKLDLPGGFAEPGETAEQGVRREVMEELKLDLKTIRYLGSRPNVYEYGGVAYQTCDLFFHSKIEKLPTEYDKEEVAELLLMAPADVPSEEIAFQSTRMFLPTLVTDGMRGERV